MPGSPAEPPSGHVVLRAADYRWFADLALGEMARIVEDLGDELANEAPALPGANSPFAILTHCLGVVEYWGGATVAGRRIERDRAAEFTARGQVAGLLERTESARRRLHQDLDGLEALAAPAQVVRDPEDPVPYTETKGAVLLHILEELFQHLGQMEITRDVLQAPR
jgi:uncharacterized damage-inducible protein DinB